MSFVIHFLGHGMAACLMNFPPAEWPPGHKWDSLWENVNCPICLAGRELINTYTISADGKSITCLGCKRTSHNPGDVTNHYCGFCHVFHDDIWPPARRAWINQVRKCRGCGCTENQACNTLSGPCHWVEPNLCSACADTASGPLADASAQTWLNLTEADIGCLQSLEPIGIEFAGVSAFFVLSALQLALRHPGLQGPPRETVAALEAGFRKYVSVTENLASVAEAGNWKAFDVPRQPEEERKIILPG